MSSAYRPARWLPGPHAMTIYPALFRPRVPLSSRLERFELPDGDFVDLAWVGDPPPEAPVVAVFHGLEGSLESSYVRGILSVLAAHGWRAVLMHFRGCSGEPNRLPRTYHAGETEDPRAFLRALRARYPEAPLAAIAYSLGGNILLKYLGEEGAACGLAAAVAVSVPMMLSPCSRRLQRGFSRVYDRWLLHSLKAHTRRKRGGVDEGLDLSDPALARNRNLWQFDDRITGPLHGFAGAEAYYQACSSRPFLRQIGCPTLIIQAKDDPFMSPEVIPRADELSPSVRLELSEAGGHVGFVSGPVRRPEYWLEQRIPSFLAGPLGG